METMPRREFSRMKGEGHLGDKRDKTVYFHPSAGSRRIHISRVLKDF